MYDQLTGKTWAWFTGDSAQYLGISQKWTAAALERFWGTSLNNGGEGNLSDKRNSEQSTWLFILLGRNNGQMCNYILMHGL